jgi:hypothetical protein
MNKIAKVSYKVAQTLNGDKAIFVIKCTTDVFDFPTNFDRLERCRCNPELTQTPDK